MLFRKQWLTLLRTATLSLTLTVIGATSSNSKEIDPDGMSYFDVLSEVEQAASIKVKRYKRINKDNISGYLSSAILSSWLLYKDILPEMTSALKPSQRILLHDFLKDAPQAFNDDPQRYAMAALFFRDGISVIKSEYIDSQDQNKRNFAYCAWGEWLHSHGNPANFSRAQVASPIWDDYIRVGSSYLDEFRTDEDPKIGHHWMTKENINSATIDKPYMSMSEDNISLVKMVIGARKNAYFFIDWPGRINNLPKADREILSSAKKFSNEHFFETYIKTATTYALEDMLTLKDANPYFFMEAGESFYFSGFHGTSIRMGEHSDMIFMSIPNSFGASISNITDSIYSTFDKTQFGQAYNTKWQKIASPIRGEIVRINPFLRSFIKERAIMALSKYYSKFDYTTAECNQIPERDE